MKKKFYKKPIFIIIAITLLIIAIANGQSDSSKGTGETNTTNQEIKTEETKKEVEKVKVDVTSQIVKKVNKKYRYFFDIRNNDTKAFEGKVIISLYKSDSVLGKETFTTNKAIEPTLGNSVNFDINTGPVSQYGENGITKFKYSVMVGNDEINSGEGIISDKFENLDY